jgi:hypothetical protein
MAGQGKNSQIQVYFGSVPEFLKIDFYFFYL